MQPLQVKASKFNKALRLQRYQKLSPLRYKLTTLKEAEVCLVLLRGRSATTEIFRRYFSKILP